MAVDSNEAKKLINTLEAPAYYIASASRLVGISRWRVSRYLKGYDYTYDTKYEVRKGHQPPLIYPKVIRYSYASFLDLIDLLFVKEFIAQGFPLRYIRRALDEAREFLGTPHFARSEFFSFGRNIFLKIPKDGFIITLLTHGQYAIRPVVELLSEKIDFERITGFGLANRWYPRGREGGIVIDPRISFGRPTLIGRGIATENIFDIYQGENEQIEPVSKWFDIPVFELQAAVQFEQSLCV